jgi:hypothetical protein
MKGFSVVASKVMKGLVLGAALFVSVASASSFDEVATVNSLGDFEQKYGQRFTVTIDDKELIDAMKHACWSQNKDIFGFQFIGDSGIDILISLAHLKEFAYYNMLIPFADREYTSTDKGNVLCTSLVNCPAPLLNNPENGGEYLFSKLCKGADILALDVNHINSFFNDDRLSSVTMQITDITTMIPNYEDKTFNCFEVVDVQRNTNRRRNSLEAWLEDS